MDGGNPQAWRIGVDIGGTFTDLVLARPGGIHVAKVPSVPADPAQGVLDALDKAAAGQGLSVPELLGRCAIFVHGSTIATNTLLEGKGAKVGLLTTEGFRDSLEIRRGMRDNPWEHRTPYPPVLVPRFLRRPVPGRIDRDGNEVRELDGDTLVAEVDRLRDAGVESVAICLFNSFLNSKHEEQVAEAVRARHGDAAISVSSAIAPVMGEYERGSTAVLNAYVAPRTIAYLKALSRRLAERGLTSPLLLIQSNGGAISVDQLGDRPVTLMISGPAAGVGALQFYAGAIGSDDLVSMEIGGTSCDVILMSRGQVAFTDMLDIGGYKCVTPSVEVHTIGAGGGTIAHVDSAGLLHVGPQGAGARPGPACYGLGGTEPTITDAQVVLGRLKPGRYAGGAVAIDAKLAFQAVERAIAKPLGLDVEEAASGMIRLMDQKLLHAVQRLSTERGHDPRRFTLVAAGGAGPLHGAGIGRALGCRRVYLPRLSGAFCALGMLHADMRHDYVRMHLARLDDADRERIAAIFAGLEAEAGATLQREGFANGNARLLRALDLRYLGQQWDVTVAIDDRFDAGAIRRGFEAEHDRLFGHIQPGGIIEITKLRVTGIGTLPRLEAARPPAAATPATPVERRKVWVDRRAGWQEVPIYEGASLDPGHTILGPAIINEATTTVLVGAGDTLSVDAAANFSIALPEDAA
jgi:N-methylhydantoinase A